MRASQAEAGILNLQVIHGPAQKAENQNEGFTK